MKKIPRSTILPQEMGDGEWIIFIPAEEGEEISFFEFLLRNNITLLSTAVSPGVSYARILLLFPYLLETQENENCQTYQSRAYQQLWKQKRKHLPQSLHDCHTLLMG